MQCMFTEQANYIKLHSDSLYITIKDNTMRTLLVALICLATITTSHAMDSTLNKHRDTQHNGPKRVLMCDEAQVTKALVPITGVVACLCVTFRENLRSCPACTELCDESRTAQSIIIAGSAVAEATLLHLCTKEKNN